MIGVLREQAREHVKSSTAEPRRNRDQLEAGAVVDDLTVLDASSLADAFRGETVAQRIPPLAEAREIDQRERNYRWLLATADALAALLATGLTVLTWGAPLSWPYLLAPLYAVAVAKLQGLYDRDEMALHKTTMAEWRRLLQPAALTTLAVYVTWHLVTGTTYIQHLRLFAFLMTVMFAADVLGRMAARNLARRISPMERVLVVGEQDSCQALAARIRRVPGVELAGILSIRDHEWSVEGLTEVVRNFHAHRIVVGPYGSWREPTVIDLIRTAKWIGVRVSMMPNVMTVIGAATIVDTLDSMLLLGVPRFGLTRSSLIIKRTMDLVLASCLLLVLSPVLLLVAIAIKLDSRGPVFYRQTRVGRDGLHFRIMKFRSMVDGAEHMRAELDVHNEAGEGFFKVTADPRVTRVGRLIRAVYVDELPQLFNVLRGEMSLVGPRPLIVAEDELLTGMDRHRLRMTPGMTGPWQLRGPLDAPLEEMAKMDYLYASTWSVWEDLDILLATVARVCRRRGH
jgi:exopolysaccharide biosynthesis polyprenyl glycosylphosphotransferase